MFGRPERASRASTRRPIGSAAVNGRCEGRRHRLVATDALRLVLAVAFLVDWRAAHHHRCRAVACGRRQLRGGHVPDTAVTTPASAFNLLLPRGAAAANGGVVGDAWLRAYAREFGNADAANDLGRWCAASGGASARRPAAPRARRRSTTSAFVDVAGDVDDPVRSDWGEMCRKFAAYRAAEGDGQVPKKYKLDPAPRRLGGGAPRARARRARTAELDALGFEWVSTRQCGSAFGALLPRAPCL